MTAEVKRVIFEVVSRTSPTLNLEAAYTVNGKPKTLLKNGQVISEIYDPKKHGDRDDLQIRANTPYVLEVRDKEDAVKVDFWSRSPGAVVPGPNGANRNTNCKKPLFRLIDKEVEGKVKVSEIKLRGMVFNLLNNTDPHSRFNLAAAIGVNPVGKSDNDRFVEIYNWSQANPLEFLKVLNRSDLEKLIIIRKAIYLQVIRQEKNVYMCGDAVIGKDEKEILAYYEHNAEQYQAMRRSVAFHDNVPLDFQKDHSKADAIAIQDLSTLDEVIHRTEVEQETLGQLVEIEAPKRAPGRKKAGENN